ncbi:alpha/beta fold hydrolase [Paludibacterium purpuratum]|uniref:Pimeloyl-ACP methyl ester carboxylesterase n=1 Tax=Paludibacterium purpuratum TaxID=1144873 RepID=A0A4R7B2F2_9NEIS|nr:alpha/beta hydrolase [Paludibacterium purpuratum]TDR77896.1 pimeloyl-ACP methyl ester carboxylesterase [Paludibacterium purpuratum]
MLPTYQTAFLPLRQHRHHLRQWGNEQAPLLVLLHGWMDSSATFQFLVEALRQEWHVVAPDWRGFGDSDWNRDSYYPADYLADLDALLEHLSPHRPVFVVGHSMGAMVAGLYAGIRPERVRALALVEGFGLPDSKPDEAPGRYARWLKENRQPPAFLPLPSLEAVAAKLLERNPRLRPDRALWLAEQLTRFDAASGQWVYRADPCHKMVNPILYRLREAQACWRRIACPVQWVMGGDMWDHPMARGVFDTLDSRRACFAKLSEVTVADAGHMIQWEQPEALAQALETFFTAN